MDGNTSALLPMDANAADKPRLLSVPDTARSLGITERHVWNLISTGELLKLKIGRRALITAASIDAYVDRLVTEAKNGASAP